MTEQTETPDVPEVPEVPATPDDVDTLSVPVAELRPALEAILMVSDEPLGTVRLASVVGHPVSDVEAALEALATEYAEQGRGFDLRSVAGGWRFYSRPEFAGVGESFVLDRIGITSLDELPELAPYLPDMDDLEDELASVAGLDASAAEPTPSEASTEQPTHHPSPHSGAGTEPHGGTETT